MRYEAPAVTTIEELVGALMPIRKSFCEVDRDECPRRN